MIKKMLMTLAFVAGSSLSVLAQDAKAVLDKCAAVVSSKDGVTASFTMESAQYGNASGTIAVKGKMFHATTAMATMWFDGSTQWTYLANNEEVSVTTPTEAQQQALNPYNFITMYQKGYKWTMTTDGNHYQVHLTAKDSGRKIQEMFITIDKKTYAPNVVKLLQKNRWTTFTISDLKSAKLSDSEFRFNAKDFPKAEVIDLR